MRKMVPSIMALILLLAPGLVTADLATRRAEAAQLLEQGEERKAYKAWRTLAEKGDNYAQYVLSGYFQDGIGVRPDPVDAYAWAALAAEADHDGLHRHRDALFAALDHKSKGEKEAEKLISKYGKEALYLRYERATRTDRGASCVGSRLSCRHTTVLSVQPGDDYYVQPDIPDGSLAGSN